MTEKIVTARKSHKCYYCHNVIRSGEKYLYDEFKEPKYKNLGNGPYDFKQVGINYRKVRYCLKCKKRFQEI